MVKINKNNITIGSDPEVFVKYISTGKVFPCINVIGGTKKEPIPITEKGHAYLEDNVCAEFNIPPCKTVLELKNELNYTLDYIEHLVSKKTKGLATIEIKSSNVFDDDELQHPQALEFGCEPDFNVYLREQNKAPSNETNIRAAGGHIHVGYEDPKLEITELFIKMMDLYLAVPALFIDPDTDRRELYGKAGCFRFKGYGFEYRTLSNFWIKNDELIQWVFDTVHLIVDKINKGFTLDKSTESKIIKAINETDLDIAKELLKQFEIKSPVKNEVYA